MNVPDRLGDQAEPGRAAVDDVGVDRRGAVVGGSAGVVEEQQHEQRGEHAADQLEDDVRGGVAGADLSDRQLGHGHGGVEVGARRGRERVDEHAEGQRVKQAEAGEVELQRARVAHREDRADEEDEQERADALRRVRGHAARFDGRVVCDASRPRSKSYTCACRFHLRL